MLVEDNISSGKHKISGIIIFSQSNRFSIFRHHTFALSWSLKLLQTWLNLGAWPQPPAVPVLFHWNEKPIQVWHGKEEEKLSLPIISPQDILAWQGWHLLFWDAAKLFKNHEWHQFRRREGAGRRNEERRREEERSSSANYRCLHCFSRKPRPYLLSFFLRCIVCTIQRAFLPRYIVSSTLAELQWWELHSLVVYRSCC